MKKVKEKILDGNPQLPESNTGSAATTHGRVAVPRDRHAQPFSHGAAENTERSSNLRASSQQCCSTQCEKSIPHLSPTRPAPLGAIANQLGRIADALEELVRTAKEKENLPPTPPIREKEGQETALACARGRNLMYEGALIPTLDEVKSAAPGLGVDLATAEEFWNYYEGIGWHSKGSQVRKWRPLLKAWQNAHRRFDKRDAARIAHIDAKMDERERKRERRAGGGRKKADNYIASTPEQVKEFTDGL